MESASATPPNPTSRHVLIPDAEVIQISSAGSGWWAIVEKEDGTRTSVPVAMFALLTSSFGENTWIEAITLDEFAMEGMAMPDLRIRDYRYDPRPETFERYLAARKCQTDPSGIEAQP